MYRITTQVSVRLWFKFFYSLNVFYNKNNKIFSLNSIAVSNDTHITNILLIIHDFKCTIYFVQNWEFCYTEFWMFPIVQKQLYINITGVITKIGKYFVKILIYFQPVYLFTTQNVLKYSNIFQLVLYR